MNRGAVFKKTVLLQACRPGQERRVITHVQDEKYDSVINTLMLEFRQLHYAKYGQSYFSSCFLSDLKKLLLNWF